MRSLGFPDLPGILQPGCIINGDLYLGKLILVLSDVRNSSFLIVGVKIDHIVCGDIHFFEERINPGNRCIKIDTHAVLLISLFITISAFGLSFFR